MIRKYKGQLRDRIDIAINLGSIMVLVDFAFTPAWHYTTVLEILGVLTSMIDTDIGSRVTLPFDLIIG